MSDEAVTGTGVGLSERADEPPGTRPKPISPDRSTDLGCGRVYVRTCPPCGMSYGLS